jgi:hypothetical protein
MKTLFTLLAGLFMATAVNAQCTQAIYPSPGFTKITSSGSLAATGTGYWICEGLTVTITASPGSAYYCEQNVTLNIVDSDGDQVFAKPGCIINNSSTGDIDVTANYSTITMNNTGSGTITAVTPCATMVYDYSLVGGTGGTCESGATAITEKATNFINVYPNPVINNTNIFLTKGNVPVQQVSIVDVSGQVIKTVTGDVRSVSVSGLENGNYIVLVKTSEGVSASRIVIWCF